MSFKQRYLNEADTVPTAALKNILEPSYKQNAGIQQPTMSKRNVQPPTINNTVPLSPGEMLNASKPGTPTKNDLEGAKSDADRQQANDQRNTSRTPQTPTPSVSLSEVTNPLTERLQVAGINTGFNTRNKLQDIVEDPKKDPSKAGIKNPNTGTEASFGLGKSDATRAANDNLKSGMGLNSIQRGTSLLSASTHFKVGKLVEEADIDPKWGTHAPGSKVKTVIMKKGVQPVNHTQATHKMIDDMNNVIKAKQTRRNLVRRETMPEVRKPAAATQTMGLHMNDANVRSRYKTPEAEAKDKNAEARLMKEQRLSQGQQNG
jgi:hypothetical protein